MRILGWNISRARRIEKKESRTARVLASTNWGRASWTKEDYRNFAEEAYLKNVIAYRCIAEIALSGGMVPWKLYTKDANNKDVEVINNPYASRVKRANPKESWNWIVMRTLAFLSLAGNAFLERVGPDSGPNRGIYQEFYSLRPDRMDAMQDPRTGRIGRYEYSTGLGDPAKWEVDPITEICNILHLKEFHPIDDFWGAAPTKSAAREIDIYNEMTEWNKKLMENNARPGMIFMINGSLSPDAFDRLELQLKEDFSGSANSGRNLIVEGDSGSSVQPYGWSPMEIDHLEGGREIARRICHGYRVPPQVVGIPGESKYKNYEEARLHCWEDTVIPKLSFFRDEVNNWLFPEGDLFFNYCLDNIAALAIKRQMFWERAQQSDFLTINEKREMVNKDPIDGGDVVLVPATMIPIGVASEGESNEVEKGKKKETAKEKEKETIKEKEKGVKKNFSSKEWLEKEGFSEEDISFILGENNE